METMATDTLPGNLTGNYLVRATRHAFQDAHHWLPRKRDRAELRRQALKLRYWPEKHPSDDSGVLLDMDWSWIRSLPSRRIGELRIGDTIGGRDNLRVIFFHPKIVEPVPHLWVIAVMQKNRDDFTKHNLATFRVRRELVLERFYNNP